MFTQNWRSIGVMSLAIAMTACGTLQAASSGRAGTPADGSASDARLTEFDGNDMTSPPAAVSHVQTPTVGGNATDEGQLTNSATGDAYLTAGYDSAISESLERAIALDQQNEQQRLAYQGANAAPEPHGSATGDASAGPTLVP